MAKNPVQIVLNTRDYFVVPEPGVVDQRRISSPAETLSYWPSRELVKQAASIAASFQRSGMPSGVVKVRMRREAWAKSHDQNAPYLSRPNDRALERPESERSTMCHAARHGRNSTSDLSRRRFHTLGENIARLERNTRPRQMRGAM